MAKIRIKTDMVDIKLVDVKPDEFTGAWKWVLDVLEIMNASKGKAVEKEIDDTPFDLSMFEKFEIIHTARTVVRDMYSDILKAMPLDDALRYDVCADGKERFNSICDEIVPNDMKYPPNEAALLTGKICSKFFCESLKK